MHCHTQLFICMCSCNTVYAVRDRGEEQLPGTALAQARCCEAAAGRLWHSAAADRQAAGLTDSWRPRMCAVLQQA